MWHARVGCVCGTNDQDAGGASPEGPGTSPSRSGMPRAKGRGCPRSSRTSPRRGRGYPRAAGDIPNAARDVPGGRGYHRRGVGDIMVAGISPTFFGNVPARPGISPGGPGMSPGTGSRKGFGLTKKEIVPQRIQTGQPHHGSSVCESERLRQRSIAHPTVVEQGFLLQRQTM